MAMDRRRRDDVERRLGDLAMALLMEGDAGSAESVARTLGLYTTWRDSQPKRRRRNKDQTVVGQETPEAEE